VALPPQFGAGAVNIATSQATVGTSAVQVVALMAAKGTSNNNRIVIRRSCGGLTQVLGIPVFGEQG
jgi:hypothetical protein